jgi:LysM repeat protein
LHLENFRKSHHNMNVNRLYSIVLLVLLTSCGITKEITAAKNEIPSPEEPIVTPLPPKEPETELLEATTTVKVYADMVKEYVGAYSEIAKEEMRKYGIPASITLAQGILESGAGAGELSLKGNNHFGIKCHKEWQGETVYHDDDEKGECFRKYEHPNFSFEDHSLFLTSRSRYHFLFSLPKDDYVSWAKGLREAGYATDSKYPDKLIGLIERYQLYNYDTEVLGKDTAVQPEGTSAGDTHVVQLGETLYSISKKYGTTIEMLMSINNLSTATLSIGQPLKIKPSE